MEQEPGLAAGGPGAGRGGGPPGRGAGRGEPAGVRHGDGGVVGRSAPPAPEEAARSDGVDVEVLLDVLRRVFAGRKPRRLDRPPLEEETVSRSC